MGANLRSIRRKIRTVSNIWQITRAMQMVAAAKLKRVQPRVEASREFFNRLSEVTTAVASNVQRSLHPYLQARDVDNLGLVIIAGDKGLAGSHNANVFRMVEEFIARQTAPIKVVTIGVKAAEFSRRRNWNVVANYDTPTDLTNARAGIDVAQGARGFFDRHEIDVMHVAYTEFVSPMRRNPLIAQLLPIGSTESTNGGQGHREYIFEPPAPALLAGLLPRTVDARLVHMLLQSIASEHAARMTSMTAATENADELRQNLTRELNRARQQLITTEILEVVGGANALEQGG